MSFYSVCLLFVILFFSIVCSISDIKKRKVSNWIIFAGCFFVILINLILNRAVWWHQLISGTFCGLFYLSIRLITKGKLGTADIYFGIFQGLCLPWNLLPISFALELSAAPFALLLKKPLPFIPFMSFGLIITTVIFLIFV